MYGCAFVPDLLKSYRYVPNFIINIFFTKQSFCHCVNNLKCPLPLWIGSKNIGAFAALYYDELVTYF